MELDKLFGLPAHPLIVHAAVVLVPMAAVGLVVVAALPRARRAYAPLVLAAALGAVAMVFLAQRSGEAFEERVRETDLVERHTDLGASMLPWAIAPAVVAAGITALAWWRPARARAGSVVVTAVAVIVAVLAGGGATWKVVEVGHSGSKAAWSATVDGD